VCRSRCHEGTTGRSELVVIAQVLIAGAALAAARGCVRCADHRVGDVLQLLQLLLVLLLCVEGRLVRTKSAC